MPIEPPVREKNRGVDADQVAVRIDQRAARVALVDRRVGLNEVLESVDAEIAAPERGNDAHRYGLTDVKRIADREHDVADLQGVRSAERDRRQVASLDLQYREVAFRVGADQLGFELAAVR